MTLQRLRSIVPSCLIGALAIGAVPAHAQEFAAMVAPPRFELKAKPGERLRNVFELTNGGRQASKFRFRTADWTLGADGQVVTHDDLQSGSCRPWVAIERPVVEVPAGARMRYRFEVTPPTDARSGECRFAVLIEGDEAAVASGEGFRMPVKGRIAVIVYVAVGDASAKLEIERAGVIVQNGQRVPAVYVRNSGTAHGRLGGFLTGTDTQGTTFDFSPASLPILPGEVRAIVLTATNDRDQPTKTPFPVAIRGTLEWAGGRLPFEHRFE